MAKKTAKKMRNVDAALAILRGEAVLAHDRRKSDAHAIEFKSYRRAGKRVISPVYGVSNTVATALGKLADRVTYEGGMPYFHFSL